MLCLSGFELYPRWVPLILHVVLGRESTGTFCEGECVQTGDQGVAHIVWNCRDNHNIHAVAECVRTREHNNWPLWHHVLSLLQLLCEDMQNAMMQRYCVDKYRKPITLRMVVIVWHNPPLSCIIICFLRLQLTCKLSCDFAITWISKWWSY